MLPQIVSLDWYKVAMVALVCFLSTVRFQMLPQNVSLDRCKVALVALVWFFSTVRFQMLPQNVSFDWCKVVLVALVLFYFSPLCVFKFLLKCFLKLSAWIDVKSHWSQLFDLSSLCLFKCLHKLQNSSFQQSRGWVAISSILRCSSRPAW